MGIDQHLLHTCDVERAERTQDSYKAEKLTWQTLLTGVRCRLVVKAQRVSDTVLAEQPIVTSYRLFVPPGTDVRVNDRITNLVFEDATEDAGPYRIGEVLTRRARSARHVSLLLEKLG